VKLPIVASAVAGLALLACVAGRASAQGAQLPPAPAGPAGPAAPAADEPAEDAIEPAFNVEVGSPLKLSANLGIRLPLGASGYGRGLLLQVQPGLGGGSLNIGYVPVSFGGDGMQLISVGAKAKLLRTWGSPWGTEPDRTYAGFEAGFAVGFKLAVGVLWRLDSGAGDDTLFTWTVGFGM
jgi:hypothetical protein